MLVPALKYTKGEWFTMLNKKKVLAQNEKEYKEIIENQKDTISCLREIVSETQKENLQLIRDNTTLTERIKLLESKDTSEEEQNRRRYSSFIKSRYTTATPPPINISYKDMLTCEAKEFIDTTTYNNFEKEIKKVVIGQNIEPVLASVYNYVSCIARDARPSKNNVIVTGPSGSGKSETFRALAKYFEDKIPSLVVHQVDLTHLTVEGFKGNDTSFILSSMMAKQTGGYGIIFLDELDKRIKPVHSSDGENVGVEVQSQLLAVIEGSKEIYRDKNLGMSAEIDSGLTMFIGCGSFDFVREMKKENAKKTIGFVERKEHDHFDEISREDILMAGGTYEFIGRFSLIVNYNRLSRESTIQIIDKLKKEVEQSLSLDIELDNEYLEKLIESSNSEFGCRLIYSMMYEKALKAYIEILRMEVKGTPVVTLSLHEYSIQMREVEQENNVLEENVAEENISDECDR